MKLKNRGEKGENEKNKNKKQIRIDKGENKKSYRTVMVMAVRTGVQNYDNSVSNNRHANTV